MSWLEEVEHILLEARGDMGLAVGLMALRKVEWGAPGREWGVLSVPAPTYADQLKVAANSFRRREQIWHDLGRVTRAPGGLYDEGFLRAFSARWSPVGANNDPGGTNAVHADNLVNRNQYFGVKALDALRQLA